MVMGVMRRDVEHAFRAAGEYLLGMWDGCVNGYIPVSQHANRYVIHTLESQVGETEIPAVPCLKAPDLVVTCAQRC